MQLSPLQMLTKEEQTDVLIPDTFQQTSIDKYKGSLHLSGACIGQQTSLPATKFCKSRHDCHVTDPGGVVDDIQLSSSLSRLAESDVNGN